LRLRQILANLIGNAIKFTTHGQVVVHIELDAREAGWASVRLSVQDTGIGIAPDAHEQIFEQFSQADNSTTRRYGGTDLGLAICRQLTELMGGCIGVESAPGLGSRFIVDLRLPLAHEADAPMEMPSAQQDAVPVPEPLTLRGRILLVEDNPVNQSVAGAMLRKLGLHWELAENGAVAVERVRQQRFDLILMDCQMPVMDGYEATAIIRKLPARGGTSLPIVALTANSAPGEADRCLAAGMDAFLAKPFTIASLRATLSRWLPVQDTGQQTSRT
jgi:CheY-like chemotaxis protein